MKNSIEETQVEQNTLTEYRNSKKDCKLVGNSKERQARRFKEDTVF